METEELLKKKNVIGVGTVGKRIRGGRIVDADAMRVYVCKKVPLSELEDKDIVPQMIDDIPIDIIDVGGEFIAEVDMDRKGKVRPVTGGYGEGNILITVGTGGPLVRTTSTPFNVYSEDIPFIAGSVEPNTVYRLSNAHCYCEDPRRDVSKQERRIAQPGRYDDSNVMDNLVGQLESHVVIEPGHPVTVDAALRSCSGDESNVIEGIGVPSGFTDFVEGDAVTKSGRTTGITTGTITDTCVTVSVNYGGFTGTIRGCYLATRCSSGGDSGSTVVKFGTTLIGGLVFAGSPSTTCIVSASNILKVWNLEVVQDEPAPPNPPKPGFWRGLLVLLNKFIVGLMKLMSGE